MGPGFGSLRFTKKYEGPESAERAARYVSKYLTKYPQHGYPAWVLDARYRIRRYSASRGFWGESAACDRRPDDQTLPEELEQAEGECAEDDEGSERKPAALSIRERLAKCGECSAVFRLNARVDPGTGELIERREFVCRLFLPLADVREALWGAYEAVHPYCVRVDDDAGRLALGQLVNEPGLS